MVYFLYKEFHKIGYSVSFNLFDSSLYGVPQKRERFIMFGSLSQKPVDLPIPSTTESIVSLKDAIVHIQNIEHSYINLRDAHTKYLKLLTEGQNWKDLPLNIQAEAMGKSFDLQGGKTGFYRRLAWDKPAPTLVTHPAMPATMLAHPEEMRPLSIQEYALIQQFPKEWSFAGKVIDIYKQIGNAVPVGLGYAAGMAIQNHKNGVNARNVVQIRTSRYNQTSYLEFIPNFERAHVFPKPKQLRVFEEEIVVEVL